MARGSSPDPKGPGRPCILIVNVHSTKNAGDAALLLMNIRQLCAGFGDPSFLISANYFEESFYQAIPNARCIPSAFSLVGAGRGLFVPLQILRLLVGVLLAVFFRFLPLQFVLNQSSTGWLQLVQSYCQADLIVAVSGNQFLSMGKYGWPFPLTTFPIWMAHLYKKPFYVMPQSVGPFKRDWERQILKSLYGRARLVYLRDQISIDLAKTLGIPEAKTRFSPDPAFALPSASREEAVQILSRYGFQSGRPVIGITVIAPIARTLNQQVIQQYYRDLAAVLHRFINTYDAQVFIFNQVTGPSRRENDRLSGYDLLSLLPEKSSRIMIVDEDLSPGQLKACYGCMDLMIASRLHSGIFSMAAGTATLLIGYFTKARGLMQAMSFEEWMLEIGQAREVEIWEKLSVMWPQRHTLAEAMRRKANDYATVVLSLGTEIREDYERG